MKGTKFALERTHLRRCFLWCAPCLRYHVREDQPPRPCCVVPPSKSISSIHYKYYFYKFIVRISQFHGHKPASSGTSRQPSPPPPHVPSHLARSCRLISDLRCRAYTSKAWTMSGKTTGTGWRLSMSRSVDRSIPATIPDLASFLVRSARVCYGLSYLVQLSSFCLCRQPERNSASKQTHGYMHT